MKPNKLQFKATGMLYVLAVLVMVAFVLLGNWQLRRADEKQALQAKFESGLAADPVPLEKAQRFQRVRLAGTYDSDTQLLLDNMVARGRAGFHVLTLFLTNDGNAVIVNRGWLPFASGRSSLPDVSVAETSRVITGFVDRLPRAGLQLNSEAGTVNNGKFPRLVQFPDIPELERIHDRPLHHFIVKLDGPQDDSYLLDWRIGSFGPDRHLAYALQWYSLALVVGIVTVVMHRRRRKKGQGDD